MPTILPTAKRRRPGQPQRSAPILWSLLVALLLVTGAWWWLTRPPTMPAAAQPAAPACISTNQSFCPTEAIFRNFVAVGNYSGLLERQPAVPVVCNASSIQFAACQGAGGGLTINTFAVIQPGATAQFTRNGYIAFFRDYQAKYGPFRFTGDNLGPNAATMNFTAARGGKSLHLNFTYQSGAWQFQSPAVN